MIPTPRRSVATPSDIDFEVSFNTHSIDLGGDPALFSVPVDARGREHKALAWAGDPPGGYHRKETPRFKALAGEARSEWRVNGVAGVPTRRFGWLLR